MMLLPGILEQKNLFSLPLKPADGCHLKNIFQLLKRGAIREKTGFYEFFNHFAHLSKEPPGCS